MGMNRLKVSFDVFLSGRSVSGGLRQTSPTEPGAQESGNQQAFHNKPPETAISITDLTPANIAASQATKPSCNFVSFGG